MPTEEEEEAPSITEFNSSTHVLPVGQTARYTCHAGGTPEPTVEWLHNGRPLERNGTDNQSEAWVERGFLFVRGVRYGVNTVCCIASNSAGTANHSAELLVFGPVRGMRRSVGPSASSGTGLGCSGPSWERISERSVMPTEEEEEEAPSITEFNSSTHVLPVGQTARYTCHAGGTPEPTVEWLHNGRPLERNGTDNQSEAWVERGFLFVRGGRYGVNTVCCMASNSAGTANHSAELLVFDACELTLDPNTANGDLALSEDNRKVTWVAEDQSVGVYLDRPAGSLSFYRVSPGGGGSSDTLTHLHTFWSSFTQEDLLPGFRRPAVHRAATRGRCGPADLLSTTTLRQQ
ncbi:unnamed protein product [Gadus morhua 'NCC']